MTTAASAPNSALNIALQAVGWALMGALVLVAAAFAFAAALAIGAIIAGAALALRLAPRRRAAAKDEVLNARQTPDGWVVELDSGHRA